MPKLIDITGQRFGRLTVVSRAENDIHNKTQWRCICMCGKEIIVPRQRLRNGDTKSCGCLNDEQRRKKNPNAVAKTRLYHIWQGIKTRTGNINDPAYKLYGERGIAICEEWKASFRIFEKWALSNGYSDNLTIDRIDNNKSYYPENCRWVSNMENCNNTRRNHCVTINNETKTLSQWADVYGIKKRTVHSRISKRWDEIKAITTPIKKPKNKT